MDHPKKRKHQSHRLHFYSEKRRLKREGNDCFVKKPTPPRKETKMEANKFEVKSLSDLIKVFAGIA
ncbi:hypothetical protein D8L90_11925, partial [Neisseria gonorrhoeae]